MSRHSLHHKAEPAVSSDGADHVVCMQHHQSAIKTTDFSAVSATVWSRFNR